MTAPAPNPPQEQDLLQELARGLQGAAPEGWRQIKLDCRSVGRHHEVSGRVVFADGRTELLLAPLPTYSIFAGLRRLKYDPNGGGTWFTAEFWVEPNRYQAQYDHDFEPAWDRVPPPSVFAEELDLYPRSREHTPAWLVDRIAGRTPAPPPAFREAKVFDAKDANGRPMVNRQQLAPQDVPVLAAYLEQAPVVLRANSFGQDEFAPQAQADVPLTFHTDGVWIWSGAVHYYLRKYGLPPEPELVEHIRKHDFRLGRPSESVQRAAVGVIVGRRPATPAPPRPTPPEAAPLVPPSGAQPVPPAERPDPVPQPVGQAPAGQAPAGQAPVDQPAAVAPVVPAMSAPAGPAPTPAAQAEPVSLPDLFTPLDSPPSAPAPPAQPDPATVRPPLPPPSPEEVTTRHAPIVLDEPREAPRVAEPAAPPVPVEPQRPAAPPAAVEPQRPVEPPVGQVQAVEQAGPVPSPPLPAGPPQAATVEPPVQPPVQPPIPPPAAVAQPPVAAVEPVPAQAATVEPPAGVVEPEPEKPPVPARQPVGEAPASAEQQVRPQDTPPPGPVAGPAGAAGAPAPVSAGSSAEQIIATLRHRLDQLDVPADGYGIGAPSPAGGPVLRRQPEGVGWEVAVTGALVRFESLWDAACYLIGALVISPGQAGPQAADPTRPEQWPFQPLPGEPPLSLFTDRSLMALPPGAEVDRFGEPTGNLTYAARTLFGNRSLPQDYLSRPYHVYRVQRLLQVIKGTAVPWFGQAGGGTGYLLPRSVAELLADGTLVEIAAATTEPPPPQVNGGIG